MTRAAPRRTCKAAGVAVSAAAAGLLALAPAPASAAEYTMKLGTPTPRGNQNHYMARFKEEVEKRAGKDVIEIKLFPSSQLGAIPRAMEGLQFGTIEGYVLPTGFLKGIDPKFQVVDTPGLFDDMMHGQRSVTDPKFKEVFLRAGEKAGVKAIGIYVSGMSAVVVRDEPIRRMEDFNGRKLRVLASDMETEALRRLGAAPVPMPLGEVLPALQRGAIDGVKSALVIFIPFKYWTVSKYLTETAGSLVTIGMFVGKRWFDGLPENLQKTMLDVADELESELAEYSFNGNKMFREIWKKNGGELIRFSPEEQKRFLDTVRGTGAVVAKKYPGMTEVHDALVDSAQRNRQK